MLQCFVAMALLSLQSPETVVNPDGSAYQIFYDTAMSETDALRFAYKQSLNGTQGHLLVIDSADEAKFLSKNVQSGGNAAAYWLAAEYSADRGMWSWEAGPREGIPFFVSSDDASGGRNVYGGYSNFGTSQPALLADKENCIRVDTGTSGNWAVAPCDETSKMVVVIEYEKTVDGFELIGNGACRVLGQGSNGYTTVREGARCKAGTVDLGQSSSLRSCAAKCHGARACKFFLYGFSENQQQCLWVDTDSSSCPEGFEVGSFSFYTLADSSVTANKGEFTYGCKDSLECCAADCKASDRCVAFEFSSKRSCELHTVVIDQVDPQPGREQSCYEKLSLAPKWMLIGENVCFGAGNDGRSPGTMQIDTPIIATKFKLVHRSGAVSCKRGDKTSSYWGCWPVTTPSFPPASLLFVSSRTLTEDGALNQCPLELEASYLCQFMLTPDHPLLMTLLTTTGGQIIAPSRDDPHFGESGLCSYTLKAGKTPYPSTDSQTWIRDASSGVWVNTPSTGLEGAVAGGEHVCAQQGESCACSGTVVFGLPNKQQVGENGDGSTKEKAGISCSVLYESGVKTSGVYWIKPTGYSGDAFQVYCEQQKDGGGWVKILHTAGDLNWKNDAGGYGDVTLSPEALEGAAKLADAQIQAIQGLSPTGFSIFRFFGQSHTDATAYLRTSNLWENPLWSMGLHRPKTTKNAAYGCESKTADVMRCKGAWQPLGSVNRIDSGDERWGDNTGWKAANDHNRYFVDYSEIDQCFEGGEGRCFTAGASKGHKRHLDMMMFVREETVPGSSGASTGAGTSAATAQWSLPQPVSGTTQCLADVFAETRSGVGAECWCSPAPGKAESFSTLEAAEARCEDLSNSKRACPATPAEPTRETVAPKEILCKLDLIESVAGSSGSTKTVDECMAAVVNNMKCGSAETDRYFVQSGNDCTCNYKCAPNLPGGKVITTASAIYKIPKVQPCENGGTGLPGSHSLFTRIAGRTCPDAVARASQDDTLVQPTLAACQAACIADEECSSCVYLCAPGTHYYVLIKGDPCASIPSSCGGYLDIKSSRAEPDSGPVRKSAIFDLDAAKQKDGEVIKDARGNSEWGMVAATTFGGRAVFNLDGSYLTLGEKGTLAPVVGSEYTHVYWIWWRESDAGWRTLFRGNNDHCALVHDGDKQLGFYSNRNGQWFSTSAAIQTTDFTYLVVTGQSSDDSFNGISEFYLGDTSSDPVLVGSTPRVCTGTEYANIGVGNQGPGKLAVALAFDRVLTGKEIQTLYDETKVTRACARPAGWCSHAIDGIPATYAEQDCDGDGVPDPTCEDRSGSFGVRMSSSGCSDTWPRGQCVSKTCGGVEEETCQVRELNKGAYYMEGQTSMDAELIFEAPNGRLPIAPSDLQLWYGEDRFEITSSDNSGTACADVYAFATPDDDEWLTVFSEDVGSGLGSEYDGDAMHLLNFPSLESDLFARGDYYVRFEWAGNQYFQFKVPAGNDIFKQAAGQQNIEVNEVLTSVQSPAFGSEALFCHACYKGGPKFGDTCWGVTPLSDSQRGCGCNSGGWAGNGIYYGGYVKQDQCAGQGGGFTGPKLNGQPKGKLPSIGLTLKVRSKCRDATYLKNNECLPTTSCTPNQIETQAPAWNSDRKCQACPNSGHAGNGCRLGIVRWWNFKAPPAGANSDTDTIKTSLADQITQVSGVFKHAAVEDHIAAVPSFVPGPHCGGYGCVTMGDTTALDLTSGQGYLQTGTKLPSGPKTVSFWVSAPSFEQPQVWLGNEGKNMFYLGCNSGMLEVGAGQTEVSGVLRLYSTRPRSSDVAAGSATAASSGFFHHFTMVDNGAGQLSIYQDGKLLGVITYKGSTETQVGEDVHFAIGGAASHLSADASKAVAAIDEVKVFSRALTTEQIGLEWGGIDQHPPSASEWKLVLRHSIENGGEYWPKSQPWKEQLALDNGEDMQSKMNQLESFRSHDGYLTFKMVWPTLCSFDTGHKGQGKCDETQRNYIIWRQKSNPAQQDADNSGAGSFEELDLGWFAARSVDHSFKGLERSAAHSMFDGSTDHNYWFFAAGAYEQWGSNAAVSSFPGPIADVNGKPQSFYVNTVELHAYNYFDEVDAGASSACSSHRYSKMGNACCRNEDGDTAPKKELPADTAAACSLLCDEEGSECMGFEFRKPVCELHLGPVHHVQFNKYFTSCSCFVKTDQVMEPQRVYQDKATMKCVDLTVCHADREFEVQAPSPVSDRVCKPCLNSCPAGSYLTGACAGEESRQCVDCPAGSACTGGGPASGAVVCPSGSFQNAPKQAKCLPCSNGGCSGLEAGMYGDTEEAQPCPAGYYCPAGSISKSICTAGNFCPAGAAMMTPCLEGTTSSAGQSSCAVGGGGGGTGPVDPAVTTTANPYLQCPPGSHRISSTTASSSSGCALCDPGTFSSATDAAVCAACTTSCPAGSYLVGTCSRTSTPICGPCLAGYYCNGDGVATPCPAETHLDVPGGKSQADCVANGGGSSSSASTRAGYYDAKAGGEAAICPPGSFCPAGTTSKFDCTDGTFAAFPGLAACGAWQDCPAGQYVTHGGTKFGDRSCSTCGADTFSTSLNANECTAAVVCTPGQYAAISSTSSGGTLDNKCIDCVPSVSFSDVINAEVCQPVNPCSDGFFVKTSSAELGARADNVCEACPPSGCPNTSPSTDPSGGGGGNGDGGGKKSGGALTAALIVVALLAVGMFAMFKHFKGRMGNARVILKENDDGEMEGMVSFSNSSYDASEGLSIQADEVSKSGGNGGGGGGGGDDDDDDDEAALISSNA